MPTASVRMLRIVTLIIVVDMSGPSKTVINIRIDYAMDGEWHYLYLS